MTIRAGTLAVAAVVLSLTSELPTPLFVACWGGQAKDLAAAIVTDRRGGLFVVGSAYSRDFPTTSGEGLNGNWCAFATKLRRKTGGVSYSTALCTNWMTWGWTAAARPDGQLWMAGSTAGTDLVVTSNAAQPRFAGASNSSGAGDAFVVRWSADGGSLRYTTYLGGSGDDSARALLDDEHDGIWIGGRTASPDFPVSSTALEHTMSGDQAGFLAHIDFRGRLVFATYFGGSRDEEVTSLARLDRDRIVVVGNTDSLSQAAGGPPRGRVDGFIAVFDTRRSQILWQRRVGGPGDDYLRSVATLRDGTIVAAGHSDSATCQGHAGGRDGWIVALSAEGDSQAVFCFGGTGLDEIHGVAAGDDGGVWVTGLTASRGFPLTVNPTGTQPGAADQSFVAQFDPSHLTVRYAARLTPKNVSGIHTSRGDAIAVAPDGDVFVTGEASGSGFAPSEGAFRQGQFGESTDVFVVGLRTHRRWAYRSPTRRRHSE